MAGWGGVPFGRPLEGGIGKGLETLPPVLEST